MMYRSFRFWLTALLLSAPGAALAQPRPPVPAPVPPVPGLAPTMWFLGGSSSELPACTSCELTLPASGTGSFGVLGNVANDQLSPGVAVVASRFSVRVEVAPGAQKTRSFFLFARGSVERNLRCDITGASTRCTSGAQTLALPAGSVVLIDAANTGSAPPTRLQFSWGAR